MKTTTFALFCFVALITALVTLLPVRAAESQEINFVYSLAALDGAAPGNIVRAPDGTVYGATTTGGSAGQGTIYSYSPGGQYTVLHTFAATDGAGQKDLLLLSDGTIIGVAGLGGASGKGTIFKIANGVFSVLHSFNGDDGFSPAGRPAVGSDGALYGVTTWGGATNEGAAFRITTAGDFKTLAFFTAGSTGAYPATALTAGPDGNLYGATTFGGPTGGGTIVRLTPTGSLEVLHALNAGEGLTPSGQMLVNDGALIGVTSTGGTQGAGTVFRLNITTGKLDILHSFGTSDGLYPRGSLLQDEAGAIYGTTYRGGSSYISPDAEGYGTLYRIDTGGIFNVLAHFNPVNGAGGGPAGQLIRGTDGALYGTTTVGGTYKNGTIYRLALAGAAVPVKATAAPAATPAVEESVLSPSPAAPAALETPSGEGGPASYPRIPLEQPANETLIPPAAQQLDEAPVVTTLKARRRRPSGISVSYVPADDRGPTQEVISVLSKRRPILSLTTPFQTTAGAGKRQFVVRKKLSKGKYSVCVEPRDAVGNTGQRRCTSVVIP